MKVKISGVRRIKITGEHIRLDALLKFCNMVMSGGEAKSLITSGLVYLNGAPEMQRGKKIRVNDVVRYGNETVIVIG